MSAPTIALDERRATIPAEPISSARAASDSLVDQIMSGAHAGPVGEGHTSDLDQTCFAAHSVRVEVGTDSPSGANPEPASVDLSRHSGPFLLDPTLLMAAQVVDDLERTRIANENRLRQMTRTETDVDGEERGFGLTTDHPDVARLAGIVEGIVALEHQAVLGLQRAMRRHPLGPWVKEQRGVGEKQAARLLAAIGDPYWNTLHDRPRTVSELWAYCGLHTLPSGQSRSADHASSAAGATLPADQLSIDTRGTSVGGVNVAAKRRKGTKANWSSDAKSRAYLIGAQCVKTGGPYRDVYDARRGHTAVTHPDWTAGHSHNDAIRIAAKVMLRDLWRASRDLHENT